MESNKNYKLELIYKTETNSQMSKPILWFPKGKLLGGVGGGSNWEGGNNVYTLLYKIDD